MEQTTTNPRADPAPNSVAELLANYECCLAFAERSPNWVRLSKVLWIPKAALLRYLVARHVSRGLAAARRGVLRGQTTTPPSTSKDDLDRIDALGDSIERLNWTPRAIFVGFVLALVLSQAVGWFDTEIQLISDVVSRAISLDAEGVAEAIREADDDRKLGAAVVALLALPLLLLVPAMGFILKRRVFRTKRAALASATSSLPAAADGDRGTYDVERSVLQSLGTPVPREVPLDLILLASTQTPGVFLFGLIAVDMIATGEEGAAAIGLGFLAAAIAGGAALQGRHRSRAKLATKYLWVVTPVVVLVAVGMAVWAGKRAEPYGIFEYQPPKPAVRAFEVTPGVTLGDVATAASLDMRAKPERVTEALFGDRTIRLTGTLGAAVAYVADLKQTEGSTYVRWSLRDAATSEQPSPHWHGIAWPRPTVRFVKPNVSYVPPHPVPQCMWIPLPKEAGRYYVRVELLRRRDAKLIAGDSTSVFVWHPKASKQSPKSEPAGPEGPADPREERYCTTGREI